MSKQRCGVRPTRTMVRFRRWPPTTRLAVAGLIVLGWAGACSDGHGPGLDTGLLPTGFVVSDPIAGQAVSAQTVASFSAVGQPDDLTYASLMPGTVPQGVIASVRGVGSGSLVWTTVHEGGFNPVAVTAAVGDVVEIVVRDQGGAVVFEGRTPVAAARAPIVVRTYPPHRKRDVALNAVIVIVFSEPIARGSLTPSSVQLFRGPTPVAGTVSPLQGNGAAVAFSPARPLSRDADYRLVVTRAVRDLDGDILEASATVAFTTGQSPTGPAASIDVSPDTVYTTGTTYQLTAMVRDAAGNVLIDQPVTWSSSDPAGLSVSSTGLVTPLAAGSYLVTASVNGVSDVAIVFASGGPVTVVPPTALLLPSGSQDFTATVANDPTNSGVTWRITGCTGDPVVCGTLTNITSTSATYTAPATAPPGALGVSATSVADATKSFTASVTVMAGQIAFVSYRDGSAAIYVMNANGSGVTRLTNGSSPAWSPDGTKLAFESGGDGSFGIYVMNADGSGVTLLMNGGASPAWSPDGTKLAFNANDDIHVMNADGSGARNLTNNPGFDGEASWSPDGTKLAFESVRDGSAEIYVMNADGSGVTRLTSTPASDHWPSWSPDGIRIAFTSYSDKGYPLIYVMNADGSGITQLINDPSWSYLGSAWSPDGTRIAFAMDAGNGNHEIFVMNSDGSGLIRLTYDQAYDWQPAWTGRR